MSRNVFIEQIDAGRIASEAELKRLFWKLARQTHPDTAAQDDGGELFRKLKAAYDQAREHLGTRNAGEPAREPQANGESLRRTFYRNLAELVAGGYPWSDAGAWAGNRMRTGRLEQVRKLWPALAPGSFTDMEADFVRMQAGGSPGHRNLETLRMGLVNICSWHYYPSGFAAQGIRKTHQPQAGGLSAAGYPAAAACLAWLVADLDQGAALE